MTTPTPEQRRFLDARVVAYLTKVDSSSAPHAVPVCFALAGETASVVSGGEGNRTGERLCKRQRPQALDHKSPRGGDQ